MLFLNRFTFAGWRLIAAVLFLLFLPVPAFAALTFTLTSGDSATNTQAMVYDSNNCPADGPTAMYVTGTIENTGGSPEFDVTATLSGLTGSFLLTGTQTDAQFIGRIDPGESLMVGWQIEYGCVDGATTTPTVSITSSSGGSDTDVLTLFQESSISANAGGLIQSTTIGQGAVIGQIITSEIIYDFGNNNKNDEIYLQPAGNPDFDARCFRLVGSEVTASNVSSISVGAMDQLYFFTASKQSGSDFSATVVYSFRYMCANTLSTANPFSAQTSGNALKYSGNYDDPGGGGTFPAGSNPFTITKAASPIAFLQGAGPHTTIYTVTISNPSIFDVTIDGFSDTLPSGVSFGAIAVGSDVTAANSNSIPTAGDTGTLAFQGISGTSYAIAAGGTLSLIYTATVQDTSGSYVNAAQGEVGLEVIGPATTTVYVGGAVILAVSKQVEIYDPNGLGLLAIPGNEVIYTITVQNLGIGEADLDSLFIEDALPGNLAFYNGDFDDAGPGTEPVNFIPGTSALACCTTSDVEYSDSAGAPATYGYLPIAGYDAAVSFVRFNPKGMMAASSSFQIQFRAQLQ